MDNQELVYEIENAIAESISMNPAEVIKILRKVQRELLKNLSKEKLNTKNLVEAYGDLKVFDNTFPECEVDLALFNYSALNKAIETIEEILSEEEI